MKQPYQTIERGSRGATYQNGDDTYTVYEHGTYARSSVLAGQSKRTWLDSFDSLEAAQAAYPHACVSFDTYTPASLNHLPDE